MSAWACSELRVWSRSAPPALILFELVLPWQALLMVLAEAHEGKPNCANILEASAYMPACVPLDKAGHMAKPNINGTSTGQPREVKERDIPTFWTNLLPVSNALCSQLL